jgi:hypothetical protein
MPSAKPDRRLLLPLRDALKKLPDGVGGIELAFDRADHAFGERYFSTGPVNRSRRGAQSYSFVFRRAFVLISTTQSDGSSNRR